MKRFPSFLFLYIVLSFAVDLACRTATTPPAQVPAPSPSCPNKPSKALTPKKPERKVRTVRLAVVRSYVFMSPIEGFSAVFRTSDEAKARRMVETHIASKVGPRSALLPTILAASFLVEGSNFLPMIAAEVTARDDILFNAHLTLEAAA